MNDTPSDEQKKKIIIDEDWKSQVEAEKERAKRPSEKPAADQPSESEATPPPPGPLPPPSLDFVVSSFAMQAMVSLGLMANPLTNERGVHLDQAKHFIDTVDMLQKKTEGNRTPEEDTMMETILHELRMTYVAVQQQGGAPPAS